MECPVFCWILLSCETRTFETSQLWEREFSVIYIFMTFLTSLIFIPGWMEMGVIRVLVALSTVCRVLSADGRKTKISSISCLQSVLQKLHFTENSASKTTVTQERFLRVFFVNTIFMHSNVTVSTNTVTRHQVTPRSTSRLEIYSAIQPTVICSNPCLTSSPAFSA